MWYAFGLLGHSLLEVVVRAFYALHDTRTPVAVTLVAMLINIGFSLTLPAVFGGRGWLPLGGLALANSLATTLECTVLIVILRRRLNGIEGRTLWDAGLKSMAGVLGMCLALWGWLMMSQVLSAWLVVIIGVVIGGLIYVGVLAVVRVPELVQITNFVRRKLSASIQQRLK